MRHYMQALRSELSRYRKRTALPLTGLVAGVQPNTFKPGLHYVSPELRAARSLAGRSRSCTRIH